MFLPFNLINVLGEANFLGGVANVKGVKGFSTEAAKKRFFEIYLEKVTILRPLSKFACNFHLSISLMPFAFCSMQNQILE